MKEDMALRSLSREQLEELLEIYAKNWLAMDGVWFQSVEASHGMEEAMKHDAAAWERFTVIEARRLKAFLQLPEQAGLEGDVYKRQGWHASPGSGTLGPHQPAFIQGPRALRFFPGGFFPL